MTHSVEKTIMTAGKLGRNILENGGEICRVEEAVNYFLEAYGVYGAQIFTLPSCVIISIEQDSKPVTHLERIKGTTHNFDKLAKFNDLCRRACTNVYPLDEVMKEINSIRGEKEYSFTVSLLAYGVSSALFCLFWNGQFADACVSFVCGLATKCCLTYLSKIKANMFITNAFSSLVIAYIALACVHFGIAANYDKIIIGAIMMLVPGLALTNVMRDIIAGDIITGTAKLSEVLLVAAAIAVGIALAMSSVMMVGGVL